MLPACASLKPEKPGGKQDKRVRGLLKQQGGREVGRCLQWRPEVTKTLPRPCAGSMIRAMHLLSLCLKASSRNLARIPWPEVDLFWKCQRPSSGGVDCGHVDLNCDEYFGSL